MELETHCKASLICQVGLAPPMADGSEIPPPTGADRIRGLRAEAERARRLAKMTLNVQTAANLRSYADDLEAEARKLEEQPKSAPQAMEAPGEPDTTHAITALKTEEPGEQ